MKCCKTFNEEFWFRTTTSLIVCMVGNTHRKVAWTIISSQTQLQIQFIKKLTVYETEKAGQIRYQSNRNKEHLHEEEWYNTLNIDHGRNLKIPATIRQSAFFFRISSRHRILQRQFVTKIHPNSQSYILSTCEPIGTACLRQSQLTSTKLMSKCEQVYKAKQAEIIEIYFPNEKILQAKR